MWELLTLICDGTATVGTTTSAGTSVYSSQGTTTANTTVYGTDQLRERLTVRVVEGTVAVRMPASLQPPIGGRGNDGWRQLTDVQITDEEIRGRFSYNWLNRPSVRIDRMTGDIEVDAMGQTGFRGTCTRQTRSEPLF
jgi:hypothetical protein